MPFVLSWVLCITGLFLAVSSYSDESPAGITGAVTVDVFQAKQLYDRGALFVDVRADEEWSIGHIAGAVHLDFQRDFAKLYAAEGVTRDTPLVLYCNSSNCLRSAYASAVSVYWGFKNVFYFRAGYFAWLLEDFPAVMSHVAVVDERSQMGMAAKQ
ncbi:rhodanese-like domain-containing protein [Aestuariicella hydrocarbonica]|uniref:Rhodanese-like domain-containing protein n=1 Tax=Pseudomaricurvus hydrocarbonicus TaxID=1470433 RepID=A0A9E5MMS4_9GAMM|nr:rhodanese-like domain-containing protein [Aestuariicella hydrocarbonica]NHO67119.1 rhodanese-like domain-containing protein [Aestuariicella hydrocarbonica]